MNMNVNTVSPQTKTMGFKALVRIPEGAPEKEVLFISKTVAEHFPKVKAFGKNVVAWGGRFYNNAGTRIAEPKSPKFTHYAYEDGLLSIRFANTFKEKGIKGAFYHKPHPPVTTFKTREDVDKFFPKKL